MTVWSMVATPPGLVAACRCTADCGWVTGHTYLTYGPLLNGAKIVVFEGVSVVL